MRKQLHKNEDGLASIVIAVLIIIIVSTLVLGFLQIIRREQRKSLDRQLSSQAFYAAESGVNAASKAISEQNFTGNKDTCALRSFDPPAITTGTNILSTDGSVRYTCLLINQKPGSLTYKSIDTNHSTSFPVVASDGVRITSINFNWQDTTAGYASFRSSSDTKFSPLGSWNSVGLLRLDIVPTGTLSHSALLGAGRTYYLYPNTNSGIGPGSVDMNADQSGAIVNGHCTAAGGCNVTVTNVPGGTYFVRVLSYYKPVALEVTAKDATNASKNFVEAQTLVDVTGAAADVSRRIQVTIPRQNYDISDYAIASMETLCKKFVALPPPFSVTDEIGDPACKVLQPL